MAITKAIRGAAKNHAGLRNTIEYVLRDDKVQEGYVDVIGPAPEQIGWDSVYRSFIDEKMIWSKDSGRMCAHYVVSFHKDEKITPQQALDFGKKLFEKTFPGHQVLLGVHQDKDHLHVHAVVNSVNYIDGHKLHTTKYDLQKMKNLTNELCLEQGLTVAEKGKHFDGTSIEEGTGKAWNKDKYNLISNDKKKSYVVECAIAVMDAKDVSESRDDFIREMGDRGWSVTWEEKRKHITFEDKDGHKVRDSNLSKTFNIEIGKEVLIHEFERQEKKRRTERESEAAEQRQLDEYYKQVESADAGIIAEASGQDCGIAGMVEAEGRENAEPGIDDTEEIVRAADAAIKAGRADRRAVRHAETVSRTAEEQRRFEEQRRSEHHRRAEKAEREDYHGHSR